MKKAWAAIEWALRACLFALGQLEVYVGAIDLKHLSRWLTRTQSLMTLMQRCCLPVSPALETRHGCGRFTSQTLCVDLVLSKQYLGKFFLMSLIKMTFCT